MSINDNLYPVVQSIDRAIKSSNCAKIIKLSLIVDAQGNVIGKGEPEIVKLWPNDGVAKFIKGMTE